MATEKLYKLGRFKADYVHSFKDFNTFIELHPKEGVLFGQGLKKRIVLLKKLGNQCVCCGVKGEYYKRNGNSFQLVTADDVPITMDHIVLKCKGGADSERNYQVMCMTCNNLRGSRFKTPHEFIKYFRETFPNKVLRNAPPITINKGYSVNDIVLAEPTQYINLSKKRRKFVSKEAAKLAQKITTELNKAKVLISEPIAELPAPKPRTAVELEKEGYIRHETVHPLFGRSVRYVKVLDTQE